MLGLSELYDVLASLNLVAVKLALKDRNLARYFISQSLRQYDELSGRGLRGKNPVPYIYDQYWSSFSPEDRVETPTCLWDEGTTRMDEQLHLATVTKVLQPKKIFEIGTYLGLTTSLFILNAPSTGEIISLDLPLETKSSGAEYSDYIDTDVELVRERKLAHYVYEFRLESRYQQILIDSKKFDPEPHRGTVELGFIDGAHSLSYVKNDTEKMAVMMANRGLVFWHDYGGKGRFRPLAEYLESLAEKIPIYRVPLTSLAWADARDLRSLYW